MSNAPLMPMATAVWLVENTTLTFKQIADFCKLHEVEIQLDIRTYLSAYDHDKIVSEVVRIIKDNLRRDNYVDLRVTDITPLSHLYRNMFRHAITITYRKINPT